MIQSLFLALLLIVAPLAHAQIHIPITGGGTAAPVCTVAQLAARTGPCSSLTPRGGEVAVVTDAEGQSCTATGGGTDRRIPCAYNEALAAWLPIWGFINPATGDLDMATTRAINNLASLDFAPNICTGLTNGRLTADANGLVACVEDIQSGAATSITTAGFLAAFDAVDIIDVDPAEGGSVSAGIQEALNQCNSGAGRCIVQLRADTTYTIPARSTWATDSFTDCNSETNGDDDIWIRGHGPSSVVSFTDSVGTQVSRILCVTSGSKNIVISDFALNYTSTCSGACSGTGSAALFIGGDVDDITTERMQVKATEAVTSGSSTGIYAIYTLHSDGTNPDTIPTRIKLRDNLIQASSRGVQMIACDWCEVSSNVFTSAGIPNDGSSPPSHGLMAFYEGQGTTISGNSFDMVRDGQTNVTYSGAIILHGDQGTTDAAGINRGALVSGNSITGLRTQDQYGVWMIGISAANLVGNYFSAGICSASATRSCAIDEDCSDLGGTCDTAPAKGVYFDSTNSVIGTPRGLWNSVTTNFFDGFQDSGNNCPVSFFINGSQHADSLTKNNVAANTFRLNTTTDDGICGDATRLAANRISDNYVVGSDTQCIVGTQSAGCQLSYTASTEEVTGQEFLATERLGIPHSNTVPGSCLLNGEAYHDDDAPAGQSLYTCQSGTYVLQSGSGDISSVGNCASGACFQSVAQRLFLASPTGTTGQVTARAIDDVDIPSTVCRSNGDNCPAASGAAANTEPFVTTAASGGLSNASVLTEGAMIDITSGATIAVDTTEASTGFTVGNDGGATVTVTLDPAGATTTTLAGGSGGLALTTNGNMGLTFGSPSNTFTLSGSTGDARTVLPTDSIGAAELAADSVGSAEIQADAVGSVELASDAVDVTTNPLITVNIDAIGSEPEDGSGFWIEGGSGAADAGMIWDATNNELDLIVPTGGRVSLPDPGDGSRTIIALDNTSEPTAPAALSTILYALGGEWYKKDNGDSTNERLLLNSGNVSGDLTCTSGGVCTLSSARRARVCDFNIEAPVAGDDGVFQCYIPAAATLVRVYCNATTGTSVVQLYERTEGAPSTGTTEMLTGDLTCDTDGASTTSFADSALAADALLALGLQTTYTTGTVRVHVEYTEN